MDTTETSKNLFQDFATIVFNLFDNKKKNVNGPAQKEEIIAETKIAEYDVQSIAGELDKKIPKSLKLLKESCPQCFDLPEDCTYHEYSRFNVTKACKKLKMYPVNIQEKVIKELGKVNQELSYHLDEELLD